MTSEESENVITIAMNRAKFLNVLSQALLEELGNLCREMNAKTEVGAVILTGNDKAFAAGADIKEVAGFSSPVDAHELQMKDSEASCKLASLRQPSIAAISGFALGGGCEHALTYDVRIAADNAKFGQLEINLGLIPDLGGTQRLPRTIDEGRAKELLFAGDMINSGEALRIGLVNKVVPRESLIAEAWAMAIKFARNPHYALQAIKALVNNGRDTGLSSALAYEARCFEAPLGTEDRRKA